MTATSNRREFLASIGAGLAGLSGCLSEGLPGSGGSVDRTLYVGSYHWEFVLMDGSGKEQEQVVLDRGTSLRLITFNTGANQALETLPTSVREAIPEHHELEERNEGRIPPPRSGDRHELLEEANEQYPDHSVAVVPSGGNHMGGGMMNPIALPHDATRPTTATSTVSQRGDYTLSCMTYRGYEHAYMDRDGALVVR